MGRGHAWNDALLTLNVWNDAFQACDEPNRVVLATYATSRTTLIASITTAVAPGTP